ncbi:PadR family transcriptional regulator [Geosporobacter ferrireducens]|uniref:PadR family transcriptional regulator n=1 Tax=Geosporobacter ferrireducens TaxID=1424294 RepID=A0A1D8GDQ1_9FIRM|nr:PadR family transcriptional regulator [Geosporobacter ferrireducens]AOT69026.1 PadR family transcriptional regulator [Geosporobacter ferrireducens]MTI56694.1 helix-turn-helix transcriptional regulator [Geosporobacter ferrireducens]
MKDKVLRKLFLGFIQIHILHHASKEPVFGLWMIEELQEHGYEISAGTLYPIFHNLEKNGLLTASEKVIEGKVRKYYGITAEGKEVLKLAKEKAMELIDELE